MLNVEIVWLIAFRGELVVAIVIWLFYKKHLIRFVINKSLFKLLVALERQCGN